MTPLFPEVSKLSPFVQNETYFESLEYEILKYVHSEENFTVDEASYVF